MDALESFLTDVLTDVTMQAKTLTVGGKRFACHCGGQLFLDGGDGTYTCTGCGEEYEGEKAQ